MCECVGPEACDAYLMYHGCARMTEILEGFNTGSTNLSVAHVCINLHGPSEMFHCWAADGKAID